MSKIAQLHVITLSWLCIPAASDQLGMQKLNGELLLFPLQKCSAATQTRCEELFFFPRRAFGQLSFYLKPQFGLCLITAGINLKIFPQQKKSF